MKNRSNRNQVVDAICEHVKNIWNSKEGMCLGRDLGDCVDYLAGFFRERDGHRIARKLGFRPEDDFPHGLSVSSVFCKALNKGMFSEPFYVSVLDRVAADVHAKDALATFRRKWCSDAWPWSISLGENDICLEKFISEAERALENVKDRSPQSGKVGSSMDIGGEIVERTDGSSDIFSPFYPAPSFLDLALVPGAATCLAQLKAAVLPYFSDGPPDQGYSGRAEGTLSLRRAALISINGEGGVGKTSACKLLCVDLDIRKYFKEGAILWIDVGQGVNEGKIITELQEAVSSCGGKLAANEMQRLSKVSAAVERARQFFLERRLLVIVDNVWETPAGSRVKSWADTLSKITDFPGSAIIMTTRFSCLAQSRGINHVELGRLNLETEDNADWKIAENLYDVFVNETAEKQALDGYKNSRRKALHLSCGLPLGITTFAFLVHRYSKSGGEVAYVLGLIEKKVLGLAKKSVGEAQKSSTGHDGLHAAMKESLRYLDDHKGQTFVTQSIPLIGRDDVAETDSLAFRASYEAFPGKAFSARYAALKVMPAATLRLSFNVLFRLWHVPTAYEAENIAMEFLDIGLGRIEGGGDSGLEKSFALHDLQLDFCDDLYCSTHELIDGHALILSSCHSLVVSKSVEFGAAMWAKFCFEDVQSPDAALRNYLSNNLIRHLCSAAPAKSSSSFGENASSSAAALKKEVLSLLCKFCWLRGQFNSSWGRNSLLRDFRYVFESGLLGDSEAAFLHELQETLMLVREDELVESDGTLASSLIQLAQPVKTENTVPVDDLLQNLVRSAEEEVRGAWLKPVSGCHTTCEPGVLRKAFVSTSGVQFLSRLGDETYFVSLCHDGTVRIHDVSNLGTALVVGDIGGTRKIAVAQQLLANGSSCVFTGDANEAVFCYEVSVDESGTLLASSPAFVGATNSPIRCLSASRDGQVVAAGCDDGNFCVWKLDGGFSGSHVPKITFFCLPDAAYKSRSSIHSVAVSVSGDLVAAGTYEGGFYIWKEGKESTERVGVGPTSLTSEDDRFQTRTAVLVSLSSDETRLIVLLDGTHDGPPACEIWNIEAEERRLSRVELPELLGVSDAKLEGSSADKKFEHSLLVGGYDGKGGFLLLEYSIGDGIELVRRYPLAVRHSSSCRLEISDVTGLPTVIVGDPGGSVRVLGPDALDASPSLKQRALLSRERGMRLEEACYPTPSPELAGVNAVAVMPAAGRVVAGDYCGRLSLWSAENGSFQRVVGNLSLNEKEADWATCIDISGDESVAVTGHKNGTVCVWETRKWTVCRVLEGHAAEVFCVAALRDGNRIDSVDENGEWRVWDAVEGGAALGVVETGLKFSHHRNLFFFSSDGGRLIWAGKNCHAPWKAKVIEAGRQCVVFESDEHEKWHDLCAEVDATLSHTEAIGSCKEAAGLWNKSCQLRDFDEESGRYWQISTSGSRVQCELVSIDGSLSDTASINLDSEVWSIEARWLPHRGYDGRRRAIVACSIDETTLLARSAPAIMHFIAPKL